MLKIKIKKANLSIKGMETGTRCSVKRKWNESKIPRLVKKSEPIM